MRGGAAAAISIASSRWGGRRLLMVEIVEGVAVASLHGRYRARSRVKARERRPDGGDGWVRDEG